MHSGNGAKSERPSSLLLRAISPAKIGPIEEATLASVSVTDNNNNTKQERQVEEGEIEKEYIGDKQHEQGYADADADASSSPSSSSGTSPVSSTSPKLRKGGGTFIRGHNSSSTNANKSRSKYDEMSNYVGDDMGCKERRIIMKRKDEIIIMSTFTEDVNVCEMNQFLYRVS